MESCASAKTILTLAPGEITGLLIGNNCHLKPSVQYVCSQACATEYYLNSNPVHKSNQQSCLHVQKKPLKTDWKRRLIGRTTWLFFKHVGKYPKLPLNTAQMQLSGTFVSLMI